MPYKDPERKRQWEQEHCDQRNARRRAQRIAMRLQKPRVQKTEPDSISDQKPQSIWTVVAKIAGFALAVGIGVARRSERGVRSRPHRRNQELLASIVRKLGVI